MVLRNDRGCLQQQLAAVVLMLAGRAPVSGPPASPTRPLPTRPISVGEAVHEATSKRELLLPIPHADGVGTGVRDSGCCNLSRRHTHIALLHGSRHRIGDRHRGPVRANDLGRRYDRRRVAVPGRTLDGIGCTPTHPHPSGARHGFGTHNRPSNRDPSRNHTWAGDTGAQPGLIGA